MKERTAMAETNILRGQARPRLARVSMASWAGWNTTRRHDNDELIRGCGRCP